MPFEINRPLQNLLTGNISAHVHEINSVEPTTILEVDKEFVVHISWSLDGPLTPFVAGTWQVNVFFESIGPGPELKLPLPTLELPLDPNIGPNYYEALVSIPANTLKDADATVPYKMVTTVTYRTPKGRPGPMAGFVESPVLQTYAWAQGWRASRTTSGQSREGRLLVATPRSRSS
jgi:hypothetical protein